MKSAINKFTSFLFLFLIGTVMGVVAQTTTTSTTGTTAVAASEPKSELSQPMAIVFIIIIILLLLVILAMVNVVKSAISKVSQTVTTASILLVLLFSQISNAIAQNTSTAGTTANTASSSSSKLIAGLTPTTFYVLLIIVLLEIVVIFYLIGSFKKLLNYSSASAPQSTAGTSTDNTTTVKTVTTQPEKKEPNWFYKLSNTKVKTKEDEEKVNTGHNFDGIKELDNPTPPWWRILFWAGLLIAVVYIWRYHVAHSAPNQQEELAIANQKAEDEINAKLATGGPVIDENNVTYKNDAASLNEGKTLFTSSCIACHAGDGGGGIGPNLTDKEWLHGCTIQDIFKTIKYGVPEKGMQSWKDVFSPKQMNLLASYVKSLGGSKPIKPKEPQGVLCEDKGTSGAPAADSSKKPAPEAKKTQKT